MGGRLFDWLGAGIAADLPPAAGMAALLVSPGSTALYFETDTKIVDIYDESGPSWFAIDAAALAAIAFATLPDVDLTGISDGDTFKWDVASGKVLPLTPWTIESLQDLVGAMVVNGTGTVGSYDDTAGTFKFDSSITQYTDEMAQDALAAAFAAGTHTGLTINYTDGSDKFDFTVTITQYTNEMAMDAIAAMLAAGTHTGITVSYNDAGDAMSLASTITQYTDEMAMDAIAAMIAAGTDTGLTVSYNDSSNLIDITVTIAAASDVWTGTNNVKSTSAKALMDSAAPVTVTYGATVTLDGNTGFNFELDLTGNVIMANPTNMKAGQSGTIRFKQDATGSRVVSSWGSNWEFPGGAAVGGILSTGANSVDYLSYIVSSSGKIRSTIVKSFGP